MGNLIYKITLSLAALLISTVLYADLLDGSFEQGPPPASEWIEWGICDESRIIRPLLDPWGIPAHDGEYAVWAGGGCSDGSGLHNSNYVEQTFLIPVGVTDITFWYLAVRGGDDNTPGDDLSYAEINGTDVWTLDLSTHQNDTFDFTTWQGQFVRDAIDVSTIAGSTVTLRFGHQTGVEHGWGNTLFDQIELVNCGLANAVLHLRDGMIDSTEEHEACFNIYAGPEIIVSQTGNLILHAPGISFRRGFAILAGGTLSAGK